MNRYFYISGSSGQCGPITEDQLKELHQRGVISEKTPLWCEGMKDWQPYGEVFSIWSKSSFDKHHNVAWLVAGGLASVCVLVWLFTDLVEQQKRKAEETRERYYEMRDWLERHR